MFILSISISPNRETVTTESLGEYVKRLIPYLDANSSKYVVSLEKGSRETTNHIQCVCETQYKPPIVAQALNRKLSDLIGYHKGKRGYKDGSTVCVVNRTKNGQGMFGYPMKEHPETFYIKGISEQELRQFAEEFANMPDFKIRRNSVRTQGVETLINLLWKKLLSYETKETYYSNLSNVQKTNRYITSTQTQTSDIRN